MPFLKISATILYGGFLTKTDAAGNTVSIALMAVAAWLGNVGKNNRMFYIPMVFMLTATLTSLVITIKNKLGLIGAGAAAWGDWFQLIFAATVTHRVLSTSFHIMKRYFIRLNFPKTPDYLH